MYNITVKDIINVCNAKLLFGNENIVCEDFSKDTRTIKDGDVYIGIKGDNFDGNTLYEQAFENGAKVCILENAEVDINIREKYNDRAMIIVKDSIKALQDIAKFKRDKYDIPVIAITGSVGKTSTKDIIASVVETNFKVLKTQGNMNNHIGLPLTILGLKDHEALVVEMGMNHEGEISVLSKIASPDIAVITNVGTAHIGNLGSRANILKAKLEITDGLKSDGVLIINNDNDMLNDWQKSNKNNIVTYTFGTKNRSNVMAHNVILDSDSSKFTVETEVGKEEIFVPIAGIHFVSNALAAIAVGIKLGIPMNKIKIGIKNFRLSKSRMELINLRRNICMVNDCYNANFDSMKAVIEYLGKIDGRRRIAVLGDMLELGEYSESLHTKVGEEVVKNNIDILVTVGEGGKVIANAVKKSACNTKVYTCSDNQEAIAILKDKLEDNDFVIVKASNGMKFNDIVQSLQDYYGI